MEPVHTVINAVSYTATPQQFNHQEIPPEVQRHALKMAQDHVRTPGAGQAPKVHVDHQIQEVNQPHDLANPEEMVADARVKHDSAAIRNDGKEDDHEERLLYLKEEGRLQEDDRRTLEKSL